MQKHKNAKMQKHNFRKKHAKKLEEKKKIQDKKMIFSILFTEKNGWIKNRILLDSPKLIVKLIKYNLKK